MYVTRYTRYNENNNNVCMHLAGTHGKKSDEYIFLACLSGTFVFFPSFSAWYFVPDSSRM